MIPPLRSLSHDHFHDGGPRERELVRTKKKDAERGFRLSEIAGKRERHAVENVVG